VKVLSIVGARPQFVKLAPIAHEMTRTPGVEHAIVHTGQHYDAAMSDVFFEDLRIPDPDVHLGVGSGSHGAQTAAMLSRLELVMDERQPDWVLVYGDTNSTVAATLAAVKLHLPVAHLEAGLRSFNRRMPEEHNRVLTDHAADLLLAPSEVAMGHLAREGLAHRAVNVGDVMTDICLTTRDAVSGSVAELPQNVDPDIPYLVATLHRADNTDDEIRLRKIVDAMCGLSVPVVLLAHPRLIARASTFGIDLDVGSLHPTAPLPYPQMVRAVMGSAGVITDSGGLQKEAFLLRVPCSTVRTETEWIETLEDDWNILDPNLAQLSDIALRPKPHRPQSNPYGDGHAATRVVTELLEGISGRKT